MNSYKEERRLIELASDKKKSAEEIAHLMGRPPDTIRRWAVPIGDFPGKEQAETAGCTLIRLAFLAPSPIYRDA